MKKFFVAAAAATALCTPAFAADMPVKAPSAVPFSWSGFYVGANLGVGWGHTDYTWPLFGDISGSFAPAVGGNFKQSLDGGAAGGHVGYNSQLFGNWVWGMEASLDWSNIKGSSANQFPGLIAPGSSYNTKLEWFGTVTSRLGYAWDNWLIYGRFGTAAGEVRTRLSNGATTFATGENKDHLGWTIGAGVEYAMTRNWILGLEYNYYDLGHQTYGGLITAGGVPVIGLSNEYHLDPKFSSVTARLSYKFDDPRAAAAMPVKAPVYSAAIWQGTYAGIHGGYGWGRTDYSWPTDGTAVAFVAPSLVASSFKQDLNGGVAGLHSGYNYQMGNWVLGLEGSLDWSDIKGSSANVFAAANPGATYNAKLKWFATITPRIGYAVNNWLVYGKAGLAGGEMRTQLANPTIPYADGQKNDHIGWTVGAGVDYVWTPNWIVGLEYNYYDLGDQPYGDVPTLAGAPLPTTNAYHLDPKFSTVLARLTYKFSSR